MKLRLLAMSLLVASCGLGGGAPNRDPIATMGPSACRDAFEVAVGVDRIADSVSDLYPAVRACDSIDFWQAGFNSQGGAGFSGSALEVLRNVCRAPEVAKEPLCVAAS
jgi:hypothetical protein